MRALPLFAACSALLLCSLSAAQTNRVLWTSPGGAAGDNLGYAVAGCGDVDRDGLDDVLVGAPWADDLAVDAGHARVHGRGGVLLFTLRGTNAGDHFGTSVAGAGDVNGDGHADLLVGAPEADPNGPSSGRAQVFSGRDGSVLYTIDGLAAGDECGYAVGGAGDLNRDGFADFIVGSHLADAPRPDTGTARVFSGRDGSVLFSLRGDVEGDHFGAWVGGVGDVNADGNLDFMITAPWSDVGFIKSGSARVFSGRDATILYTFHGEGGGHEFGTAFANCGDLDGDGHADLCIAEPEHKLFGDDSGAVQIHSGRTGARLRTLYGGGAYEYFGLTLGAGDCDGDGVADLVIGAFLHDTGAPNGGAVFIYSGATLTRIFAAYGSTNTEQLGRGVDFAGDLDGDGLGDFVAGIPRYDVPATDAGGLRAYCGAASAPATYTTGVGCPANRPFRLDYTGTPRPGQTVQAVLSNGPSAPSVGWLVFGLRAQAPLELTFVGMPGCTLYQPLDVLVPLALTAGGATLPLSVPQLTNSCGLVLRQQAIAWDPSANALGVVLSNAGRIVVAP
jgi:hypothetical protein